MGCLIPGQIHEILLIEITKDLNMTDAEYIQDLRDLLARSNVCIESLLETITGWKSINTLDEQYIEKLERDVDKLKAELGKRKLLADLHSTEAELWAEKDMKHAN